MVEFNEYHAVKNMMIIIPSYEPTSMLFQVLESLHNELSSADNVDIKANYLVVDDGSSLNYQHIFKQAEEKYDCTVLHHAANLGKGQAIKTALNHCLNQQYDLFGVVTVDSDGQHKASDVVRCIKLLMGGGSRFLVLGCRSFDNKNVPLKSRLGNKLTCLVFSYLCGVSVSDTQTGLRAMSIELAKTMLTVTGDRFEYEMNVLIECGKKRIPIKELSIETIYLEDNSGTHFRPIIDSLLIYKTFVKFAFSALSSFALDIILFSIVLSIIQDTVFNPILVATAMARVLSTLYNFMVNRKYVFTVKYKASIVFKYYTLAISQTLLSGLLTSFLFNMVLPFGVTVSKILVDTLLFFLSFIVQREWVFINKDRKL